jgi:hypothetical protein
METVREPACEGETTNLSTGAGTPTMSASASKNLAGILATLQSFGYVFMHEEAVDVRRPVEAEHLSPGVYRITSPDPDPQDGALGVPVWRPGAE